MLEFIFWLLVIPATLASLASVRSGRKYLEYVEGWIRNPDFQSDTADSAEADDPPPPYLPPVTLIVPVKGVDHALAENLQTLVRQDYPNFEVLVTCRSASDDALRVARMAGEGQARVVLAEDPPAGTGEKVHNLLAAVALARRESEVLVFADSDGQVAPGWLRSLVSPLRDESLGAATGFRWYFPDDGGFWPLLRSVWDSAIAGNMRTDDRNFAWGGGTAIRRATFESARVADFWKGAVSDDFRLTTAMNEAGLGIRFVPSAMVATTGSCTAREFLDWATRQLVITKVYRKKIWLAGFVAHAVYCGAMAASLAMALAGHPLALGGFVVTVIPGMGKGAMRSYAARLMFPERLDWLDRHSWAYFWMVPIATWIWLYTFARSAATRTIEWRGNVYELVSASESRLVSVVEPKLAE